MFERLCAYLQAHEARFEIFRHGTKGEAETAASLDVIDEHGAKAAVCVVTRRDGNDDARVLAVVARQHCIDLQRLATLFGQATASLAPPQLTIELTGCPNGLIPPFSFYDRLTLIVDVNLVRQHTDITFRAGRIDVSIVMSTCDYLRIARPIPRLISA